MNCTRESMRLYIVTDRSWLGQDTLAHQVEQVIQAGATFVQLREKEMDTPAFLREAQEIKAITDRYQVPFVINDNVEVALACGADGVHVGQSDTGCREARAMLGPDKIVGVSVQTVEQARKAQQDGADYLGVGAVFGSTTKLDACDVSYDTLREICAAVTIPVVAIGGINPDNLMKLAGSGVDGVAVISAVFAQPDVYAAAKTIGELSEKMVSQC